MTPVMAFDFPDGQPSFSASLETWLYGSAAELKSNSVLNPDNRIANLASRKWVQDGRLDVRGEAGPLDLYLAPRLLNESHEIDGQPNNYSGSVRLSQGFIRSKRGADTLLVGRERLTWGPANFRSPSNPYYFDSGRTNPLASTPGIDLVRYTHGQGAWRLGGAYVASTKQVLSAGPSRQSALLKVEHQGESHLVSLIASKPLETNGVPDTSPFYGAFGQFSPDDAWLLYGEIGSGRLPGALQPVAGNASPPAISTPVDRSTQTLVGATYTQESGNVVLMEYLRNGAGFSQSEERRYFDQARRAGERAKMNLPLGAEVLGQLVQNQPRLMSKDYLWLGWQSNPQATSLMWRAELTMNANDRSAQTLFYAEKTLLPRVSGFVAVTNNIGSSSTEFGAYTKAQITAGFKWFGF